MTPRWESFQNSRLICHPNDRQDQRWTIKVGDIVAIESTSDSARIAPNRPYSVPWSACQILAIYRDAQSEKDIQSGKSSSYMIEIRRFCRTGNLPAGVKPLQKVQKCAEELNLEVLHGTDVVEDKVIESTALLGPLILVGCEGSVQKYRDAATPCPSFMPLSFHVYGGACPKDGAGKRKRSCELSMPKLVKEGIHLSKYYTRIDEEDIARLLSIDRGNVSDEVILTSQSLAVAEKTNISDKDKKSKKESAATRVRTSRRNRHAPNKKPGVYHSAKYQETIDELLVDGDGKSNFLQKDFEYEETKECVSSAKTPRAESEDDGDVEDENRISTNSESLYHSDISSLRSYYTEAKIRPPYKHYVQDEVVNSEKDKKEWTVKMGDIAIVHWDVGAGAVTGDNVTVKHFPMKVPWGVGEIVTIWKSHKSKEDIFKLRSNLTTETSCLSDEINPVMIEVRWLYRQSEIPGFAGSPNQNDDEYEEVLETDQLDDCHASSLLSPAKLHEVAVGKGKTVETCFGMPVVNFHCRRMWSIHRKSLMPFGSLSGMAQRGRMYSKYLGQDQVLKAAFSKWTATQMSSEGVDSDLAEPDLSREGAFREAIKKLSLTDASEDTNVRGLTLIGRTLEQQRIISFLRSAIIGNKSNDSAEEVHAKSSLFVAGPPGTGKTASVRSAIERLRHEQAQGDIPEFDFISLNGMEMRHPFDAYVKLWEAVSGSAKEKRPPEVAASLLERHFTSEGTKQDKDTENRRPVTVVLLDEIDYLVTKKQTVLYNFFDWPRRTSQNDSGPRLVVVGISNTLNLPERLKPSVQSRLGSARCDFQSYKKDDIIKILKAKLQAENSSAPTVFDEVAIEMAAGKTAAISGDVRRALQLCKTAAEGVLSSRIEKQSLSSDSHASGGPIVGIGDIMKASRESSSSMLSKAVKLSAPFEALLLVTLASLSRTSARQNGGGFDMRDIMTKMESIAGGSGDLQYMPPPTFGETLDMLNRLGAARIVSLHTPKSSLTTFRASQGGSGGAWPLVSLPVEDSTVTFALRGTPHETLATKYLGGSLF